MKPSLVSLIAVSLLSMPVIAATAEKVNRRLQFDTAIAACEKYLAEQGNSVTLPRPPERPDDEQREAIELCQEKGLLPRPPRHHGTDGGEGRPPGPPPGVEFQGQGVQ